MEERESMRRDGVFDWAEHAPELAGRSAVSGVVVPRRSQPIAQVPPGAVVGYDEQGAFYHLPAPQPVMVQAGPDPWKRVMYAGVGVGAAGLGLGYMFQAIAAATTGLGLLAACLGLVWLIKSSGGSSGGGKNVSIKGSGNRVQIR